jgi:hypothetical protein
MSSLLLPAKIDHEVNSTKCHLRNIREKENRRAKEKKEVALL